MSSRNRSAAVTLDRTAHTDARNGSAALDRPAHAETRRRARIAGIFFILTFISIAALPLYHSVLKDHSFIVGAGGDASVQLGALAEIITAVAGIGTAVTL